MLVNVYRYNLTNLEKVKKTFQEESKTIGNRESKCLLD